MLRTCFNVVLKIQRGKLHGSMDVSLSVMSINKKSKRIDLDAGDNLYHIMVTYTSPNFIQRRALTRGSSSWYAVVFILDLVG